MDLEEKLIKYPKTLHLPSSNSIQRDDKVVKDLSAYNGVKVGFFEKMDGENTNVYRDAIPARSRTYSRHVSRDWMAMQHGRFRHDIPENWRVCGENLFAKHSIHYHDLESFFYIFSIWNECNVALSWKETEIWAQLFGFPVVNKLWEGEFSLNKVDEIAQSLDTTVHEGFVVRPMGEFHFDDFQKLVTKWVRPNHVQTSNHWMREKIVKNGLK